ncbi:gamma-butyrobetaine dioxygenase-like [Dendronephthya gigantea]|uniref:gamma-butyrobetaine dioxygenase-like n=1 Tax=Dendronephthya gigantea TaxID=151771 RepID=UPI001069660C|nr:gamma-butyrobetaine dioxygenase-like [Dendronephthya gigantea]XP_028417511.1 gamma-butyrobetaine dioxygenase-like [Dendronephthya gigantea]
MQTVIARTLQHQFRCLYNNTRRCLALSVSENTAQNVYKNEDECLSIKWNDGSIDKYPYIYLRENCRCPVCYKDERKSRTMFSPKVVDLDITAEYANWNAEQNLLEVKWEDGHTSNYSSDWLKYLRYRPLVEEQSPSLIKKGIQLWGEEMSEKSNLPVFQFDELMADDEVLYKWMVAIATQTGIAKIENAPKEAGHIRKMGERVGYLVQSTFGVVSQVKAFSGDATHETGYTYSELPLHADFSFQNTAPGVAILHCVTQTKGEGGASLLVDAFHAANLLYEEDPEAFEILVDTPLVFKNFTKTPAGKIYAVSRRPILSVDFEKKLNQVCYGDEFRDNHMPREPERMKSFYKAYFRFSELLDDKRTSFWYKMKSGDIITVNNHRVLHGRSAYQPDGEHARILETAFFDWDCFHSKIRILSEKIGVKSPVD